MLKKLGILLFIIAVTAGCSTEKENHSKRDFLQKTELNARQILDRSLQAGENLTSYKMQMKVNQDIITSSGEDRKLVSILHTDLILNPLSFHQKMKLEMAGSEGSFESESYLTDQGLFFLDSENSQWTKAPQEMYEQMTSLPNQYVHPGEELKKLDELTQDMKAAKLENHYLLSLTASGPVYEDFVRNSLRQSLPPELATNEETWRNLKVNEMKYALKLDQKTFHPLSIEIFMDVVFSLDGVKTALKQKLSGTYSDHNQLKSISLPKEVLDLQND